MTVQILVDRTLLEQALEALEAGPDVDPIFAGETQDALRAALAQQPKPAADPFNCPKCGRHDYGLHGACPACDAPQPEPVQEPVAWRWGYRSVTTGEMDWRGYVEIAAHPNLRSPEIIMEPLYTAPLQRKPLTDEEITYAVREADLDWQAGWTLDEHEPNRFTTLARAVERKVRGE